MTSIYNRQSRLSSLEKHIYFFLSSETACAETGQYLTGNRYFSVPRVKYPHISLTTPLHGYRLAPNCLFLDMAPMVPLVMPGDGRSAAEERIQS